MQKSVRITPRLVTNNGEFIKQCKIIKTFYLVIPCTFSWKMNAKCGPRQLSRKSAALVLDPIAQRLAGAPFTQRVAGSIPRAELTVVNEDSVHK